VATTDESGRYRIDNLPPGDYFLAAGRVNLPTYFPGTLEVTRGTGITVRSAAIRSDINFVVRDVSKPLPDSPSWAVRSDVLNGYLNTVRQTATVTNAGNAEGGNRRSGLADHPDLVGEIKLILPPVDGEPGRGNSQVRIYTRSETNRYTGTATWSVAPTAVNWWKDASVTQQLGLTDDQIRKLDATFQPYSQIISRNEADLAREDDVLRRMVAPASNESQFVPAQEDRVLQFRKTLEDAQAKLTQELLAILSEAQREQLKSLPVASVIRRVRWGNVSQAPPAPEK